MRQKNSEILGDEWITPSLGESEYPGLILPEDSLVSEDSIVSEDFFSSGNNFTSEYFLAPQEIDLDPLTGMAKNPTVDSSDVAAVAASRLRTVTVNRIKCIRADADWHGDDDIFITVGNEFLWGVHAMDDGDSLRVGRSEEYRGETTIGVWDRDFTSSNDLIGTIRVNGYYRGPAKVVTGGGSEYLVDFTST